ncbi:MAG: DUF6686 family protein [Bacteroidota bacterium]
MYKYSVLAKRKQGIIRWCHDCKTYNLAYHNICLNFNATGFEKFKESMEACYEENIKRTNRRNCKDIFIETSLEGLQLLFSTNEIGELLSMLQEASLAAYLPENSDHSNR